MGQTLTNGIYLPDEGERNSYSGLETNWRTLDALILTINGKAAPNVANTWTAAQTFTAGIAGDLTGNVTGNVTGDLTGTASKAIADEDGTSIKTGYVNVAGDQDVTGRKTFRGNAFFTSGVYHRNNSYEIGNIPSSNITITHNFADKDNNYTGFIRNVLYSAGRSATEVRARNLFKNGTLDPTGSEITSNLNVEVQPNGSKTLYFDGSIRNNVLPYTTNTYSLGSSSYQWSSVYAQSYYYNGTAWGLDKENEWTENNIFSKRSDPANVTSIADTTLAFNGLFNTIFLNTRGSSNRRSYGSFLFVGYGSASGADNYGQIQLLRSTDKRGDTNEGYIPDTSFKLLRVNPHSLLIDFMEAVRVTNDGSVNEIIPITTNATALGTSTNKWKTINGINPGALSLPTSSYVEIDTTNWDLTGATSQSYTPAVHGWLFVSIQNIAGNYLSIVGGRGAISMDGTGVQAGLRAMLPVVANESVSITVKTGSIFAARFYPMLGNV